MGEKSRVANTTNMPSFREVSVGAEGRRVSAWIAGDGPPLVLFHSLLADRTSFDRVAGLLAARHQVVALDLPGFAGSDPVEGGLDAVAGRVAEAIGLLELGQPPILLGNGYGGFVALLTAIRNPGIASRLVLADCGAAFSEPGRAAFRNMSTVANEKGLAAISDVAMRRLFSPEYQAGHPELIEERRQRFLAMAPATFHQACAALAALDLRPELGAVRVPVLVLAGEFDEATPPAMSQELAQGLPDARLRILPGCAHVPQLQEPALFFLAIAEFLSGEHENQ